MRPRVQSHELLPDIRFFFLDVAWSNSILFDLSGASAPVLVSVVSFLAYVLAGNTLTVSTAFTAIALFSMLSSAPKLPGNALR